VVVDDEALVVVSCGVTDAAAVEVEDLGGAVEGAPCSGWAWKVWIPPPLKIPPPLVKLPSTFFSSTSS